MVLLTMVAMTIGVLAALMHPLYRKRRSAGCSPAAAAEDDLAHRKEAVFREIQDLELDRAMRKVSDEEYAVMRHDFEVQAVTVLRALDERRDDNGRSSRAAGPHRAKTDEPACPSCGTRVEEEDTFCHTCGEPLRKRA